MTTRGVAATKIVPGHPGSVAAGEEALWFGLVDSRGRFTSSRCIASRSQATHLRAVSTSAVRCRISCTPETRCTPRSSTRAATGRVRVDSTRGTGAPASSGSAVRTRACSVPRARRQDAVGAADSARGAHPRRCRHAAADRIPAPVAGRAKPRAGGRCRVHLGHCGRRRRGGAHRPGHRQDHFVARRRVPDRDRRRRRRSLVRRPRARHRHAHRPADASDDW